MVNPGDIQPVIFGITLPSASGWLLVHIGLTVLITLIQLGMTYHYIALGDRQYADPEKRQQMKLAARVTPLGDRLRPHIERLAEPERTKGLRVHNAMTALLVLVIVSGILTQVLYSHFVLPQ